MKTINLTKELCVYLICRGIIHPYDDKEVGDCIDLCKRIYIYEFSYWGSDFIDGLPTEIVVFKNIKTNEYYYAPIPADVDWDPLEAWENLSDKNIICREAIPCLTVNWEAWSQPKLTSYENMRLNIEDEVRLKNYFKATLGNTTVNEEFIEITY